MLGFSNSNAGAISAISTAILAIITAVYAYLTRRMAIETTNMRKLQSESNVIVFYRPKEESINVVELVIKNIGLGAAHNIKLNINPDFKYRTGKQISEINLFKTGIRRLHAAGKIPPDTRDLVRAEAGRASKLAKNGSFC